MKLWTMPRHYFGQEWDGYYVSLGQTRDSDSVERSNFRTAWERLNELPGSEDARGDEKLLIVRERHWACGWVEWIAIHESLSEHVTLGNAIDSRISDYPVLSEDDLSRLEFEEGGAE